MEDAAFATLFDRLDQIVGVVLLISQRVERTPLPLPVSRDIEVVRVDLEQLNASRRVKHPIDRGEDVLRRRDEGSKSRRRKSS